MKNKLITIMFLSYIAFFSIGSIVAKDRDFSQMENRNLEQFPEVSYDGIMSGEFSDDFEKYMSDQIIYKDFLVRLKVTENRVLGQKLINGTYFSDKDMLISEYINPYNQLTKNISYVNEFADVNPDLNITWLIAPNACYIYKDRLPNYATCYDQGEVMGYIVGNISDRINLVDCSIPLIENKEDYIYYNTDHHWTMNGAYIGYVSLCESLGISATPRDFYDIVTGSDEFYGTLYSNAPTFTQKPDRILLFNNPEGEYTVEYTDKGTSMDSLYNTDNLKVKDKYTTYLDGNHSIIRILSNAPSGDNGKLLVIKDSYAHSLLPLLADNFSEIVVVDLRYYHSSVSELAREEGIENIVFINNLDFLSTDNNFLWLQ